MIDNLVKFTLRGFRQDRRPHLNLLAEQLYTAMQSDFFVSLNSGSPALREEEFQVTVSWIYFSRVLSAS